MAPEQTVTPLCALAYKYGTDKNIWGYTPHYYDRLNPKKFSAVAVLELGICGQRDIPNNVTGASLWMWHDFFPNANIVGLDFDPKWMVNEGRIRSFVADETQPETMVSALRSAGIDRYDLIVDDAIHDPLPQVLALKTMLPYLAHDGLYAMEDVCPYKLPNNDLKHLIDLFPAGLRTTVVHTHKPEVILFIEKLPNYDPLD